MGVSYFLEEIARRDAAKLASTMLKLTRVITWLTVANTVGVLMQLGLAFSGRG